MSLLNWLAEQKVSDWVQGLGSLSAAGAAVGIALRQERLAHRRDAEAQKLRAQVLAVAIVPVLRDMQRQARVRRTLLQSIRRVEPGREPPGMEDLILPLPEIFMNTIDRADVFGAQVAAHIYMLVHRIEDYSRYVRSYREWSVPPLQWEGSLLPKLDAVNETLTYLVPQLESHIEELREIDTRPV